MRKSFYSHFFTLSILVAFVCSFNTYAQDYSDNFDAYNFGVQLACQTTEWTTWGGAPCTTEDPYVTRLQQYSGANSVVIVPVNDLVREHGGITTGKWYISFMAKMLPGKGGYFNTLSDFAGAASEWAFQVNFNADGTGSLDAGGASAATFVFPHDVWFQARILLYLQYCTDGLR